MFLSPARFPGCRAAMAPQSQLTACQNQNRDLSAQSRVQLAEIDNLRAHSRDVENRLIRTERGMASLEEQIEMDHKRLAGYEPGETGELQDQFKTVANARAAASGRQQAIGRPFQTLP